MRPESSDIVLVNPPYEQIGKGHSYVKHVVNRSPSLGLLFLAAQARALGYKPRIIEGDVQGLDPRELAGEILKSNPRYVAITLFTVGVINAAEIARRVKAVNPTITVIVGGPHISSMGKETLARFDVFDVGVTQEGERVLEQLLPALDRGEPLGSVGGLLIRNTEGVVESTGAVEIIKDLDALEMPAWDLLPGFPHQYMPAIYDYPRAPVATYAASRGCPFGCAFCDTSTFGKRVRYNSPERVYEVMAHLSQRYGIKHLQFVDDLFVAHDGRIRRLCQLLKEKPIDMTWSCTARVDTVRPETLKLMKQAGCWEISFGLESGSERMLKAMGKRITPQTAKQAVQWVSDAGIRAKGLFMLGYPGEDRQSIEETRQFVQTLPLTTMNLTKFTPYPGSPIYQTLYKTAIREEDWNRLNGMNFVYTAEGFTESELDRIYQGIIKSFYRQKRVRRHYAKMTFSNPTHILRVLRFFIGFLRARFMALFAGSKAPVKASVE